MDSAWNIDGDIRSIRILETCPCAYMRFSVTHQYQEIPAHGSFVNYRDKWMTWILANPSIRHCLIGAMN